MDEREKYIKTWHGELCASLRKMELKKCETPCVHCGNARKDHHYEKEQCTLYAITTHYRAVNHDEVEKTLKTLQAMENLVAACGWGWGPV